MIQKKYQNFGFVLFLLVIPFMTGCSRTPVLEEQNSEGTISRVLSGVSLGESTLTEGGTNSKEPIRLEAVSAELAESMEKAINEFTAKTTGLEAKIKEWEEKEKTLLGSESTTGGNGENTTKEDAGAATTPDVTPETNTATPDATSETATTEVKDLTVSEKETQCTDSSGEWNKDKEKCKCPDGKDLKENKCVEEKKDKEEESKKEENDAEDAEVKTEKDKLTKELTDRREELKKVTEQIKGAQLKEDAQKLLENNGNDLEAKLDAWEADLTKATKIKEVEAVEKKISGELFFSRAIPQLYCSFLVYLGKDLIEDELAGELIEIEEKIAENKELGAEVAKDEEYLSEARQKVIVAQESLDKVENILKEKKTLEDFTELKSEFTTIEDALVQIKEKITALLGVSAKEQASSAGKEGGMSGGGGSMPAGGSTPPEGAAGQTGEPTTTVPGGEETGSYQLD